MTLAERLAAAGALVPTAARGVYAQGETFARVADGVAAAIRRATAGVERLRFPPVMARAEVERIGYFRDFPHLLGTLHSFCGDEREHRARLRDHDAGADWSGGQAMSDLTLVPAACYPLYPLMARGGTLPPAGRTVQVAAPCFRREPSDDPVRLQSFTMMEVVHLGTPASALAFRDDWLARAHALLAEWGLAGEVAAADDPFFGRAAAVMARAQRAQELKYEIVLPVTDPARPTACVSANYHLDKFGAAFDIRSADGAVAHSACVGWGLERIALALFARYGIDPAAWPATAQGLLAPEP